MSATYLNAGPVSNVWAKAAGTSAKETAARTNIMPIFKSHTPPPRSRCVQDTRSV